MYYCQCCVAMNCITTPELIEHQNRQQQPWRGAEQAAKQAALNNKGIEITQKGYVTLALFVTLPLLVTLPMLVTLPFFVTLPLSVTLPFFFITALVCELFSCIFAIPINFFGCIFANLFCFVNGIAINAIRLVHSSPAFLVNTFAFVYVHISLFLINLMDFGTVVAHHFDILVTQVLCESNKQRVRN